MSNIKQLKPQLHGRFKQGYVNPKACKKLFPHLRNTPIIYRSSYEKKFVLWCENSKDVEFWGSEPAGIKYQLPDGTTHTYYPDFIVQMHNGDKLVIEIKPYNQTIQPIQESSYEWKTWVKNVCKWEAMQEYCKKHGLKFMILTERTISKL